MPVGRRSSRSLRYLIIRFTKLKRVRAQEQQAELGRRDRKRQRTREQIAETARALFAARGFDGVTVAEIAEAADVSEQTVYNHFPTKEDLVYWRSGVFEDDLLAAIRDRPLDESALSAFHRFVRQPRGMLATDNAATQARISGLMRTMIESPALRNRERSIIAGYTVSLSALLAEETGARPGDLEPVVAAAAMLGVHQALIDYARHRILEGARPPGLTRELYNRADRAVELLARGLDTYAVSTNR